MSYTSLLGAEQEGFKEHDPLKDVMNGSETILLIDDEDVILEVGRHLLERFGYTVLEAKNGRDALKRYAENRHEIDAVILDMVMPDMTGGEVFERLRELNPDVKVLLSSGYDFSLKSPEIMNRGVDGFIQKPFTIARLSRKLREVLDKVDMSRGN